MNTKSIDSSNYDELSNALEVIETTLKDNLSEEQLTKINIGVIELEERVTTKVELTINHDYVWAELSRAMKIVNERVIVTYHLKK